jgi:hypothetical protein
MEDIWLKIRMASTGSTGSGPGSGSWWNESGTWGSYGEFLYWYWIF